MTAAMVVVVVIAVLAVVAAWFVRRDHGGDRYPDVPAVGRSEAEERRARASGLESLSDLNGPTPLANEYAIAKQFDEETRRRRE